ncbi:MAG TPA: circadian clock protein KaiC [Verrucomicrobiae bacterium]|nr:circadian clock protein KaiC [Verrucomicrobiae bacterium]
MAKVSITNGATKKAEAVSAKSRGGLAKCPTGIAGFDEISEGGLPRGRPTLLCGSAGCGKTLLAVEFLVRGAAQFNEPGVFVSFEESSPELAENVRSLGFNLEQWVARKKIAVDHVAIERSEIEETGEYDLEGLFIRLDHAVKSVGAKRIVLDTLEALFSGLSNEAIVRAELRRLFRWLKDRRLTAVITGERGEDSLTRYGLEEYVADCVILLDHRVSDQITTRRLRIVKYRGSLHGTNEYPFLISSHGVSVLPITSLTLDYPVCEERISTGVRGVDDMLGGKGYYRGSSILITGQPGTGKTSLGAHLVDAACRRGERAIIFAYEESVSQVVRNLRSVGLDLGRWTKKRLLEVHAARPTLYGVERHLVEMHERVGEFDPSVVFVDPMNGLSITDQAIELQSILVRLIDFLKQQGITAAFSQLYTADTLHEPVGISSLMDCWLELRNEEKDGLHRRTIFIRKSRGMSHSNRRHEFMLSSRGFRLEPLPDLVAQHAPRTELV